MNSKFRRRRQSSMSARQHQSVTDDEALLGEQSVHNDGSSTVGPTRPSRFGRTTSSPAAAALSSSYSLPARSYIHHAGHGSQGTPNQIKRMLSRVLTRVQNQFSTRVLKQLGTRPQHCQARSLVNRKCLSISHLTVGTTPIPCLDSNDNMERSKSVQNQQRRKETPSLLLHRLS